MVLDINIIDSRVEQVSSFLVQLSIYGYSVSETDYYKSFSDSKISKSLMTSKIFSYEIIGQTNSMKLYKDIEKNINTVPIFPILETLIVLVFIKTYKDPIITNISLIKIP